MQPTVQRSVAVRCLVALVVASGLGCRATTPAADGLPPRVDGVYRVVEASFDEERAFGVVLFMDRYWRVAGNPGFDATVDYLRDGLAQAGFDTEPEADDPHVARVWVEEYAGSGHGWDYQQGTVTLVGGSETEVLLSREQDRVSLCINSFPTPPDGLIARLVDVGAGNEDDYAGKDVTGAVVLGDGPVGALWQQAVRQRGAAGVISTAAPTYVRPASPDAFTRDDQWDVFQWGAIPYDPDIRGFAFKASYRVTSRLRGALKAGPVRLRVQIDSTFHEGPSRTVIAEIPGRVAPHERIVMVAHIQEPGANDDASGCASLYELARALQAGIASGRIPAPDRTLTMLWVDEIRGSRQWLADHQADAGGVQYMFSLDMTGEDVTKTGGTFLIEKQPDPSAVWTRPSDPHSEWGASEVEADTLTGSLLNDLHLAVCARRARDTGWVVRTNPYEGGSDHTVFGRAGVPSLLNWHFTDRYYHTNLDRPDKTSPAELMNVGVAVATSAWWLASADQEDAKAAADLVEQAALARLTLEREQGQTLIVRADDRRAAEETEAAVFDAWKRWYAEALDSVLRLPVKGPSADLRERVGRAVARVRAVER